jgi:hypothetical protein
MRDALFAAIADGAITTTTVVGAGDAPFRALTVLPGSDGEADL